MSGPVQRPLTTKESDGSVVVRPTSTLSFNAGDFVVSGTGQEAAVSLSGSGSGAALTDSYIGFGSASNLLTGSANFTFTDESGGSGPTVQITGDKPQITIQDDTDATDYKTKLIQSGASLYQYSADSTGTNNEMARYAQNYISFQRSMEANVGIGTVPESGVTLHVKGSGTTDQVLFESTDAGASSAPDLVLYRNSGSPADNDLIGQIVFRGKNSAAADIDYFRIESLIIDESATSTDATLRFKGQRNNAEVEWARYQGSGIVFNNAGNSNLDFAYYSSSFSTGTPFFYIDNGNSNVGIGGLPSSDGTRLHIKGTGTTTLLRLESTDTGGAVSPVFELFRNSASPAVGDDIGQILFSAEDSAGAKQNYFQIKGEIRDPTSGSDDGELIFIGPSNSTDIEFLRLSKTVGVVVNEGGGGIVDFRVEGQNDTNLFVTDAANDNVGFGAVPASGAGKVQIDVGNSTQRALDLISRDSDAAVSPTLRLNRISTTPAVQDAIGKIQFAGEDSDDNSTEYCSIEATIQDPTSGGEDGDIRFKVLKGGATKEYLRMNSFGVIFNELGADQNFKVESNNNANMFSVDGGLDIVAVGSAAYGTATTNGHLQVKDATISSYKFTALTTTSPMTLDNEGCQSQLYVHNSASAVTINLPVGIRGMFFKFVSTGGNVTIQADVTDTINGGSGGGSVTRSTDNQIYECLCYDANKWIVSNP